MREPLKVSFTFNDTNYHGAYKAHLKHRQSRWMKLRALVWVSVALLGAFFMIKAQEKQQKNMEVLGAMFVSAGSIAMVRPLLWQMWHERLARKNPAYGSKMHYVFSERAIEISGNQGKYSLTWEELYDAAQMKKGVLLYTAKKSYLWIPKVAFDEEEWIGFEGSYLR